MATQTNDDDRCVPFFDPEALRALYETMDMRTLAALLVALATDARANQFAGDDVERVAFCIDRAAIVIDVMSGRLPDVGTDDDDDGLDPLRDLMPH